MKALILTLFILAPAAQAYEAPRAFYEVPVENELKEFATYEMGYFGKAVRGNTLELTYELPLELTGKSQVVTFTGKIVGGVEPSVLKGPNGVMNCGKRAKISQICSVKYKEVAVDLLEVSRLLDTRRASPEERAGKMQIAGLFAARGGDIGGIITYVTPVPSVAAEKKDLE